MVFLRFPFQSGIQQFVDNDVISTSSSIYQRVASYLGNSDFTLVCNGKTLPQGGCVPQDANILVTFSLPGGKGGFGSMLRAIGAQIEKTTNREACRDLSGRRLRDVNEEERLKKWIAKESEREAEKARRRKERIERLKAKPRHNFNDFEYEKKLSEAPDRVEEALAAGMEKRSKRPAPEASCSTAKPKKKHLWMDEDMSSSDSDKESSKEAGSSSDSGVAPPTEEAGCSSQSYFNPQEEGPSSESKSADESSSSSEKEVIQQGMDADSNTTQKELLKMPEILPSPEKDSSDQQEKSSKELSSDDASAKKTTNEVDTSPIDLTSFGAPSELEALGLDRLKGALMERGLKCGGTLQDRAQRLWQVKGLLPHQYPANLMAKKKK